jgi:hypothetical protein
VNVPIFVKILIMKKFYGYFSVVVYTILPIYFIGMLLVSLFSGYKVSQLISYEWWVFFFLLEIWTSTVVKSRLKEGFNIIKKD